MGTHFKFVKWDAVIAAVLISLLVVPSARPVTLSGGQLIEDFSTDDYADYVTSTGVWDTVNGRARAAVVVNSNANQPVPFGNGSDGVLSASGVLSINTDSKANGVFNYKSVTIANGTVVSVSGSNPLVIYSLGHVTIGTGVTFSLDGGTGGSGTNVVGGASAAGGSAGTVKTCSAIGGTGGAAHPTAVQNGTDGRASDGSVDPGMTGGAGHNDNNGVTPGSGTVAGGPTPPNAIAANFYTTGFVCGSGGAGGGNDTTGNSTTSASGGGGGGGGGRVRITALGNLTINSNITANGGDAGTGGDNGTVCAGNGGGGNGGAVWVQTAGTYTLGGGATLQANPGGIGVANSCIGLGTPGDVGATREDFPTAGAAANQTVNAAANQTYIVQSRAYDLDTLNFVINGTPQVTTVAGVAGSSATVSFAGSVDGSSFSDFTTDVTQISNKNYRFLKFRVTIAIGGVAGASPAVTRITLGYADAGLDKLELKFSPGCGTIGGPDGGGVGGGLALSLGWLAFWLAAYRLMRFGLFGRKRAAT